MGSSRHGFTSARRDLVALVVCALALWLIATRLDVFELLVDWSRQHEVWEADEIFAASILLPVALAVFAFRRWWELRLQLAWRARAEAELARAARLDGALLAVRTAQHVLQSQLELSHRYGAMLARHPRLPVDLREWADEAVRGVDEAIAALGQMQNLARLEEVDHGTMIGTTIDLDRSAAGRAPADHRPPATPT
jgi:hypothetical protein